MADSAPAALWVTEPDGRVTFSNKNASQFTGLSMQGLSGNTWMELVHPDDRSTSLSAYSAALADRRGFRMECRFRRADGEYRSILFTGVPRFSSDGQFAGYLGSAVDITNVK